MPDGFPGRLGAGHLACIPLAGWKDQEHEPRIFFMHPPRERFITAMSGTERAAFAASDHPSLVTESTLAGVGPA